MKFCTKCGMKNDDNNLFCKACGEKFNIGQAKSTIEEINEIEKTSVESDFAEETTVLSMDKDINEVQTSITEEIEPIVEIPVVEEVQPIIEIPAIQEEIGSLDVEEEIQTLDREEEAVTLTPKEIKKQYKQQKKEEKLAKKKGKKKKSILKRVCIVLLVIIIMIIAAGVFIVTRPQNKILLGMWQLSDKDNEGFKSRLSMKINSGYDEVDDLFNDIIFESKSYTDYENQKFNYETSLLLDNKSIIDFNIASENDLVLFQVPKISDKTLYFNSNSIMPKEMDEYITFMECVYNVDNEFKINKDYIKVLYSSLADCSENEEGNVVVTLDEKNITNLLLELLDILKEDDTNMKCFYSRFEKILENIEKVKFEPETYEIQSIVSAIEEVVDKGEKKYVKEFQNIIEDLIDTIEDEEIDFNGAEIRLIFNIDGYKIKSVAFEIDAMEIEMNYEMIPSEPAKEMKYSEKDTIDLENINDEDEVNKIIQDILIEMIDNKVVKDFINESDGTDYDTEEMIEQIEDTNYSDIISDFFEDNYYYNY